MFNPVLVPLMLSTQSKPVSGSKRVIFSRASDKEQDKVSPIGYANIEESLEPQSLDDTMAIFYPIKTR
jgi:hypothetical protein